MEYTVYSNKGKIRSDNEDSYLVKDNSYPLIAVADGMGGHQAGEVASDLAVKILKDYQFDYDNDLLKELETVFNQANQQILSKGETNPEYHGMGTTLTAAIIHQNNLNIAHIGDSRIYLLRNKDLKQITSDHSLVNELLKKNQISCQEAFDHPQKNIITQALGTADKLEIESKKVELEKGDKLLFSTDGLHDMLRFNEIKELVTLDNGLKEIKELLAKEAMDRGGNDNITFVLVEIN